MNEYEGTLTHPQTVAGRLVPAAGKGSVQLPDTAAVRKRKRDGDIRLAKGKPRADSKQ